MRLTLWFLTCRSRFDVVWSLLMGPLRRAVPQASAEQVTSLLRKTLLRKTLLWKTLCEQILLTASQVYDSVSIPAAD